MWAELDETRGEYYKDLLIFILNIVDTTAKRRSELFLDSFFKFYMTKLDLKIIVKFYRNSSFYLK